MSTLETKQLQSDAQMMLSLATGFVVETQAHYEHAAQALRDVKAFEKKITAFFDPHIKRAHDAHKALTADRSAHLKPINDAETHLKGKMAMYLDIQEVRRLEQVAMAQAAAQAEAEAQRKEELKALRAAGAKAEVKALKAEPIIAAPVAVMEAPEQPKGTSVVKRYVFEITDKTKINLPFLTPDEVAIRRTVNALGMEAQAVIGTGVVVKEVTQIRSR